MIDTIKKTEQIIALEEQRQEKIGEELDAFEGGEITRFESTREVLGEERKKLAELHEVLTTERTKIEDLIAETEFLKTEQAVRNRNETIAKLTSHNEYLTEFHDNMIIAVRSLEENLESIEQGADFEDLKPVENHLAMARTSLEKHNREITGLHKHLTILSAYLR